ncbi:polymorphic toxin-type HINT domain-containing protein [Phytohabitans houttuyneae]
MVDVGRGDQEFSWSGLAGTMIEGGLDGALSAGMSRFTGGLTRFTPGGGLTSRLPAPGMKAKPSGGARSPAANGGGRPAGGSGGSATRSGGGDPSPGAAGPRRDGGGGDPGCAGQGRRHSFDRATLVLMADGSAKPIEDIVLGDEVAATDPQSGVSGPRQVTRLHINLDTDLTNVTVRASTGQTTVLETTEHHPFWDATDGRWVDAGELKPGHRLLVHDDKRLEGDGSGAGSGGGGPPVEVTVVKVDNRVGEELMHDLTVADIHTYYVLAGTEPVLVHNCGDGAEDRLREIADEIKSSPPKRERPGTVSESIGIRPSGLLVAVHTRSGNRGPIPGPLMSALTACSHVHGGCSEVSGAAKLMNLGATPESVTTVGIQSKRHGAAYHGRLMGPCPSCGRMLSALGMTSSGDG